MHRAIVLCIAALFASGCRSDPYASVREQEWRRLEDEIYCLRGAIGDLEEQLESSRRENDALRRRSGSEAPGERLPSPTGEDPPAFSPGPTGDDSLEELRPPRTDLGPESDLPPLDQGSRRKRSPVTVASAEMPLHDSAPTVPGPATSLRLNRRLTGGNNTDGRFGDEGIMAVVEARNADGELVCDPGPMTLTLHDPMAAGDGGIVALWDFAADEVAARYRAGRLGSGIYFELPWPNRPPRRSTLRLEVRCRPPEGKGAGREIAASHKFSVDLARRNAPHAKRPAWQPTR